MSCIAMTVISTHCFWLALSPAALLAFNVICFLCVQYNYIVKGR